LELYGRTTASVSTQSRFTMYHPYLQSF